MAHLQFDRPSKDLERRSPRSRRRFGDAVSYSLGLGDAPIIAARTRSGSPIGITLISCTAENFGMSAPAHAEHAFIVTVCLTNIEQRELWSGNDLIVSKPYAAGSIDITRADEGLSTRVAQEFEAVVVQIPCAALGEFPGEDGNPVDALTCLHGTLDQTITSLVQALLPAFHEPNAHSSLFADCIAAAIVTHLAERYGKSKAKPIKKMRGGLTPLQEQAVKECLVANLTKRAPIEVTARACGISRGYLISAFSRTTGVTPHKWLRTMKLEKARRMMAESSLPITEVALLCGFSDQSHLTRHFTREFRQSPANWRNSERSQIVSPVLSKANDASSHALAKQERSHEYFGNI